MEGTEDYIKALEERLRGLADEGKAGAMSAYMRGQFAFLGIRSPERMEAEQRFFGEYGVPQPDHLAEVIRALWGLPEREFQYTALAILEKTRSQAGAERIDLLEELIVAKSWWDTVDDLAANQAGSHFTKFPEHIEGYIENWIESGNLWLQRAALLFQLKYKKRTDTGRLFTYIRRLSGSREFFIAKAVGWALREYSKTDEAAVRSFVAETPLAPLSVREALKFAERQKRQDNGTASV